MWIHPKIVPFLAVHLSQVSSLHLIYPTQPNYHQYSFCRKAFHDYEKCDNLCACKWVLFLSSRMPKHRVYQSSWRIMHIKRCWWLLSRSLKVHDRRINTHRLWINGWSKLFDYQEIERIRLKLSRCRNSRRDRQAIHISCDVVDLDCSKVLVWQRWRPYQQRNSLKPHIWRS